MSDVQRRDFLKLFGVGCAIVPIIGGVPVAAAESKIIQAPKVELVGEPTMTSTVTGLNFGQSHVTVIIENLLTGHKSVLNGDSFVVSVKQDVRPITDYHGFPLGSAFEKQEAYWELKGRFIADERNILLNMTEMDL